MTISKCVDVPARARRTVESVAVFDHGPSDEIPGFVWYVLEHR
jgi:hypothetical protein